MEGKTIKCVYFTEPDPFEEVEAFVDYIRKSSFPLTQPSASSGSLSPLKTTPGS